MASFSLRITLYSSQRIRYWTIRKLDLRSGIAQVETLRETLLREMRFRYLWKITPKKSEISTRIIFCHKMRILTLEYLKTITFVRSSDNERKGYCNMFNGKSFKKKVFKGFLFSSSKKEQFKANLFLILNFHLLIFAFLLLF